MAKMADFTGILLKNLGQILLEYQKKSPFFENFLGQERKKLILRCFHEHFE